MVVSTKRITKALIRLRGCAGWSAPMLLANPRSQVFSRRGPIFSILYILTSWHIFLKFDKVWQRYPRIFKTGVIESIPGKSCSQSWKVGVWPVLVLAEVWKVLIADIVFLPTMWQFKILARTSCEQKSFLGQKCKKINECFRLPGHS